MKSKILDNLAKEHNGYLLTSEAQKAGISRTSLQKYVKENKFSRIERGIYLSPDKVPDSLYVLQLKNTEMIYSHGTALYLHELIDKQPMQIEVTVKRGYNATHLRNKGVKTYCTKREQFENGVTIVRTSIGNPVKVYNEDKTVCDIIRRKSGMACRDFQKIMKKYVSGENKDIGRLLEYAKIEHIEEKAKDYIGLMTDL